MSLQAVVNSFSEPGGPSVGHLVESSGESRVSIRWLQCVTMKVSQQHRSSLLYGYDAPANVETGSVDNLW